MTTATTEAPANLCPRCSLVGIATAVTPQPDVLQRDRPSEWCCPACGFEAVDQADADAWAACGSADTNPEAILDVMQARHYHGHPVDRMAAAVTFGRCHVWRPEELLADFIQSVVEETIGSDLFDPIPVGPVEGEPYTEAARRLMAALAAAELLIVRTDDLKVIL